MRHLLNTLFVLTEESYLSLDGENVVVLDGEQTLGRFLLHTLEGILYFGYKGASHALMGACARGGIGLCFMTSRGRFLARTCGESRGNVLLRKAQCRLSDSEAESCLIARDFIAGKLHNARWVLERATRDHALRVDTDQAKGGQHGAGLRSQAGGRDYMPGGASGRGGRRGRALFQRL